jgi:hypothetical protein
MELNENNSHPILDEIATDESATVSGGAGTANFGLSGYTYVVGGGAVFGVPADQARDTAFQQALFVSSSVPSSGGGYQP